MFRRWQILRDEGTQSVLKADNVLPLSWQSFVSGRTDDWLKLRFCRIKNRGSRWYSESMGQMLRLWILRNIAGTKENIKPHERLLDLKGAAGHPHVLSSILTKPLSFCFDCPRE